jgi:glycosyltransferase involved in cell wall biosynthesis
VRASPILRSRHTLWTKTVALVSHSNVLDSMRILQVVPRYAPAWAFGGGVRITYDLAREWVRGGHDVTVYTSDQLNRTDRCAATRESLDGIKICRFPLPVSGTLARLPLVGFWPMGMAGALRQTAGEFDVVHVAEARGVHVGWVRQGSRRLGTPYVWSAYGGLADGTGIRRFYRPVNDRLLGTTNLVKDAATLIAQTSHEIETYKSFGAGQDRIRLIPLGVNLAEFDQLPERGRFRRMLGLNDSAPLVLFLGRIHQTKGVDLVVEAFKRMSPHIDDAVLAIVGGNHGFKDAVVKLVARRSLTNRVIFCDPLYGPARLAAYVDADVFVQMPRVYEETTLAALEACACGTPCVVTKKCEIPGLEEAGVGRVVESSVDAVAEAMRETLCAPSSERRRALIRDFIRARFSSTQIAAEYIAAFGACGS